MHLLGDLGLMSLEMSGHWILVVSCECIASQWHISVQSHSGYSSHGAVSESYSLAGKALSPLCYCWLNIAYCISGCGGSPVCFVGFSKLGSHLAGAEGNDSCGVKTETTPTILYVVLSECVKDRADRTAEHEEQPV